MTQSQRVGEPASQPQASPNTVHPISTDRTLIDISIAIARLETLAEISKDRFDRFEVKIEDKLDCIDGKVSKLENWKSWMIGGLAVLIVAISVASSVLVGIVNKAVDVYVETNKSQPTVSAQQTQEVRK